jgi:hypothetical protein
MLLSDARKHASAILTETPLERRAGRWYGSAVDADVLIIRHIKKALGMATRERVPDGTVAQVKQAMRWLTPSVDPDTADVIRAFAALSGAAEGLTVAQILESPGPLDEIFRASLPEPDPRAVGRLLWCASGKEVDGLILEGVGYPRIWKASCAARRLEAVTLGQ